MLALVDAMFNEGFEEVSKGIEESINAKRKTFYARTIPLKGDVDICINIARSMVSDNNPKHEPYLSMMEQIIKAYDLQRKHVEEYQENYKFLSWMFEKMENQPQFESFIDLHKTYFTDTFGLEIPSNYIKPKVMQLDKIVTLGDISLTRFLGAQANIYDIALQEIKEGRKRTHWMWFIFPQLKGLGTSNTSVFFGINGLVEAEKYLKHTILGHRLETISQSLLDLQEMDAQAIVGFVDKCKLHSCMTLFSLVHGADPVFQNVLNKYFNGVSDTQTLNLLK